jgi:hypothetical protein
MDFQRWSTGFLLFSLYYMCRTRFPSRFLEGYAFPFLLVSWMEQRGDDCGRTNGSRSGKMNLRSLWIIASAGSCSVHALHPDCTAAPLEVPSDARR